MRVMMRVALVLLLVACGDDDGGSADGPAAADGAGSADGAPGADGAPADAAAFALTSTAFTEGEMLQDVYTCDDSDLSPPLAWTAGPSGTQSYAIVLRDLDYMSGFVHWVIWDIPAATSSLPQAVENEPNPAVPAGAKQCESYDGSTFGYRGPCSPSTVNTYQFTVYAMDVATLPGVTTASARADVVTAILEHDLASATLSGEH
jgi:Raf kinase inhibitor-like YbhB/YbcL family protein